MKPQLKPNNVSAYIFICLTHNMAPVKQIYQQSILLKRENIITKYAICKIFLSEMQTAKFKEHKNKPVTLSLPRELTYKLKCF